MKTKSLLSIGMVAALTLGVLINSTTPADAKGGWKARHPRRAEVLGRDNNLNRRINANRGDLGGHYGQLKRQDRAIRRQEQRDARMNGGHITKGEQRQLNREENHVSREIKRDQ